jgi:hypothetical protein
VLLGTTAVVGLVGALHAVLLGTREPDPVVTQRMWAAQAAQRPKATVGAAIAATRSGIVSAEGDRVPRTPVSSLWRTVLACPGSSDDPCPQSVDNHVDRNDVRRRNPW